MDEFTELDQFDLLKDEIKTFLKPNVKKLIGKKIENSIKIFGPNFNENCCNMIISDEEYQLIFQEQRNTFM